MVATCDLVVVVVVFARFVNGVNESIRETSITASPFVVFRLILLVVCTLRSSLNSLPIRVGPEKDSASDSARSSKTNRLNYQAKLAWRLLHSALGSCCGEAWCLQTCCRSGRPYA